METLLGMLVGALLIIRVEEWRKPRLGLKLLPPHSSTYPEDRPARVGHVVTLQAMNKKLPYWARWMSRSTAERCRASITFFHLDGQNVFGRSMPAKWVRTTEGTPLQIIDPARKTIGFLLDPERLTRDPQVDIAPGESADLDVAVRFDDEQECYGWNLDSYRFGWRNPNWRLPAGRYLVRAEVYSGDQGTSALYRLSNDGPTNTFRLEPALDSDKITP